MEERRNSLSMNVPVEHVMHSIHATNQNLDPKVYRVLVLKLSKSIN